MKQPNTVIQANIPQNFRTQLNAIFDLERDTIDDTKFQQLLLEIEYLLIEQNKNKQEVEKIETLIKKLSRKKNKLSNQIDSIQQSITDKKQGLTNKLELNKRKFSKLKNSVYIKDNYGSSDVHYYYENPINQPYDDTRTDVVAHISGTKTDNLVIVEVIKPIIRMKVNNQSAVVQKGIVTVANKDLNKEVNHEKND